MEDPNNPGRKCLAVWKDGQIQFLDKLEQDGRVIVPMAQNSEILGHIRLPKDAEPFESVQKLLLGLESLISQCIAVDEQYVPVLADFRAEHLVC